MNKVNVAYDTKWLGIEKRHIKELDKKLSSVEFMQNELGIKTPLQLTDKQITVLFYALASYKEQLESYNCVGHTLTKEEVDENIKNGY